MKQKKWISVMLCAAMAISIIVTGCGNSDSQTSNEIEETTEAPETTEAVDKSSDTAAEAAKKIVIFQSKVEIVDQLEELAKEYEDETGVEVEVWETTGDDYFQQVKTKLANNQGPTIMSFAPGSESQQMSAYLEELEDLSFVGNIADGMADIIDGKLVGIPYTVEGFGMVYNNNLMDASSLSSTDDLIAEIQKQEANGITGLGLSKESYFLIGHILNTPFALQDDPKGFMEQVEKGEINLKEVEAFQEFAKVYEAIRDQAQNPLEVDYDQECGDFATGKTAAIHQGNWCYSMFTDYEVDFEMGIAPLPILGNDKLAVSVPTAWYVNSQASGEEKLAAKDFLNWLYTSDTGEDYLMNEFGFIPIVDGMEGNSLDPISLQVADYTAKGKTITWATNYYPAGIVDVYLVPVAEKFFTTNMSADDFLDEVQQSFVDASANK